MWGAERGKVAEYAGVGVQEEGEAMKRFWDQVVNFFTKEA
jgi:hypothetical protein